MHSIVVDGPSPGVSVAGVSSIELSWIPLGAGASVVRVNGRMFEAVSAALNHRRAVDLYHSALQVIVGDDRYSVEMAPTPDRHGERRGVVGTGAVGSHWLGRFRMFRYENRCWREGVIPDLVSTVSSTRFPVTATVAQHLIELAPLVPTPVWGRDELRAGEMWNSNSVVAWLLVRSGGLDADKIEMPPNGRAPGWMAGARVTLRGDARQARPVHTPALRRPARDP
ncbi:MAG: hypothetical protein JWN62_3016 [Acidimicrobiales bacterium]|nr:hypothetical protein [Acidimicrobiales bacterium]